jgi:hypothetical protein
VLHVPLGLWGLIIPLVSSSSSFYSDGQQFHQYQQSEQSYITSTYLTELEYLFFLSRKAQIFSPRN